MEATALAVTCLLLLVNDTSAVSEGQLQVLSEVVSGPARGRPLALHLDAALPANVRRAVVGVEAVRRTPHLTLTFDFSQNLRKAVVPGGEFSSSSSSAVLHVVLWLTPRPELLQALWLIWKPLNLLFFSLGSSPGTDLLRHEALSGVEKVALIGHLPAQADPHPDALGVYTPRPFSGGVRLLGPWRREAFASWEALFPDRFRSFEGYTFHIATYFFDPPFLYSKPSAPDVGIGVDAQIVETMASKLNYSYTLTRESPDLKWGVIENGSWVGVLGMVARREKNFTINGFYITEERLTGFEPSESIGIERSSVFLPSPKPIPEWLSIVRPFTPSAWASFVVVVSIAVVSMGSLERATAGRLENPSPAGGTVVWQSLPLALVAQSIPTLPKAHWQRVFMAVWLLGCLVATAAYTCNLVSIFTSITYQKRLHTLQGLADSSFRIALLCNGGHLEHIVRYSPGPLYHRLRQRLDVFHKLEDAVAALQRGRHAFIADETNTKLNVMKTMGDDAWYLMRDRVYTGRLVWYFPRNVPWKRKFDENIRKLNSFGLITRWYEVEFAEWVKANVDRRKQRGSEKDDGGAPPLTLWHLQGVFYILGLAWVGGGAVLLLELLTHRHKDRLTAAWRSSASHN